MELVNCIEIPIGFEREKTNHQTRPEHYGEEWQTSSEHGPEALEWKW